ncbi:hypothetical protein ISS86_02280 [Candidatus Microgenomates bacterium]|nr:hypothetical protein [Candidatus Microgenomates bacterium]
MKRKILITRILLVLIGAIWLAVFPKKALAIYSCNEIGISITVDPGITKEENTFTVTFDPNKAAGKINLTREKGICLSCIHWPDDCLSMGTPSDNDNQLSFTLPGDRCSVEQLGDHSIVIKDSPSNTKECQQSNAYTISYPSCNSSVNPRTISVGHQTVEVKFIGWGNFDNLVLKLVKDGHALSGRLGKRKEGNDIIIDLSRDFDETGWYWVHLKIEGIGWAGCDSQKFQVTGPGVTPTPGDRIPLTGGLDPCWDPVKGEVNSVCASDDCLGPLTKPGENYDNDNPRIHEHEKTWTALGCLPNTPEDFVAWLLSAAIKIGGGIAFLLMLGGGFTFMTSSGNPEKLNQGKEILTSAIIGLLFIVFAVFLLKIIGIDIFELPGLNP